VNKQDVKKAAYRKVTVEDYVAIMNLLGEYQWLVDNGDAEGWVNLWTEDGSYSGGTAEPYVGREQLKRIPEWVKSGWDGKMRHHAGSSFVKYGADTNEIVASHYNLVTTWNEKEPRLFAFSLSEVFFIRQGDDWKITRKTTVPLNTPRKHGETQ
jgi:hypothetical protein